MSERIRVRKPHPPPSRNMQEIRRTWLVGQLRVAADVLDEFGFDVLSEQVYDAADDIYQKKAVSKRPRRSHSKKEGR